MSVVVPRYLGGYLVMYLGKIFSPDDLVAMIISFAVGWLGAKRKALSSLSRGLPRYEVPTNFVVELTPVSH